MFRPPLSRPAAPRPRPDAPSRRGSGLLLALLTAACGGDGNAPEPSGDRPEAAAAPSGLPSDPQGRVRNEIRNPDDPAAAATDGPTAPVRPVLRAPVAPWSGPWLPEGYLAGLPTWEPGRGGLPDRAAERGLDYVNRSGAPAKPLVLDANGAGVAVLDLGGDGDEDLVFSQGGSDLAELLAGTGADLEVFQNDGSANFTRAAGPGLSGWWTGLAVGDVDGDGDQDLVAGAYGDLVLCTQDGDGALTQRADSGLWPKDAVERGLRLVPGAERSAGTAPWWATSLALFDADRDGVLDLYVGQYLELDPLDPPLEELGEAPLTIPCTWKGLPVYCGPRGLTPQPDRILRGVGDGTFEDRTATWLPGHSAGFTLAVGPFDADGDGDSDLYVANDSSANLLLVNRLSDEAGSFADAGPLSGVSFGADGQAEAGMGVAFGDVDRDGRMDFAVTNFSDEPTHLYTGAEQGFETRTARMGLRAESRRFLSWSTHLEDFDGDGWLELFTANGHVYPQADGELTGTRYAQPDTLWHLGPNPRVERIAPAVRDSVLGLERGTRGSAVGDFDRDGTPDLVLVHLDAPASLALNDWRSNRLWIRCSGPENGSESAKGPRTPPDGTGARVIVVVREPNGAERGLLGETQTAEGFQSASTAWMHFGLGGSENYAALLVQWPSGTTEELPGGSANRRLWIREGQGVIRTEEFQ